VLPYAACLPRDLRTLHPYLEPRAVVRSAVGVLPTSPGGVTIKCGVPWNFSGVSSVHRIDHVSMVCFVFIRLGQRWYACRCQRDIKSSQYCLLRKSPTTSFAFPKYTSSARVSILHGMKQEAAEARRLLRSRFRILSSMSSTSLPILAT
jgi:hypothetical protein